MDGVMDPDNPMRYFNSPHDYDVDAHVSSYRTVGIVQDGGIFQQTQEPIRHVRFSHKVSLTIAAASTAVAPGDSDFQRYSPKEVVNYIAISPSMRDNAVIVSIRPIEFILVGSVYYPVGDFWVRTGAGTQVYRIPTERNYEFFIYIVPPSGYTAPYVDTCFVGFGYLPDGLEKVVIDSGQ